ncbi:hippocampus abundant transcript-like protein 1 [Forsythia ovata]|uniref:Hippocampus abundant transcript-like protein 1 n=1 Tax=Forsythia ovata TaxID=205694 RepID=A0ABD1PX80_9LAMI
MVTQGGVVCIALSYLADTVSEGKRVSAFGVLSGVVSAAYVAAVVSIIAAVYMKVFLKDTTSHTDALEHPILKHGTESNQACCESSKKVDFIKGIVCLLKSR